MKQELNERGKGLLYNVGVGGRGHIMQGIVNYSKEFEFCLRLNGKSLEGFKQESDML